MIKSLNESVICSFFLLLHKLPLNLTQNNWKACHHMHIQTAKNSEAICNLIPLWAYLRCPRWSCHWDIVWNGVKVGVLHTGWTHPGSRCSVTHEALQCLLFICRCLPCWPRVEGLIKIISSLICVSQTEVAMTHFTKPFYSWTKLLNHWMGACLVYNPVLHDIKW